MTSLTPNYSAFAIPAYYILCLLPHVYAGIILKPSKELVAKSSDGKIKAGKVLYNMPNPRSVNNPAKYSEVMDKTTFAKWERARAAHNNLLESAPFVLSAFILGIITKQPAQFMNTTAAAYLASRVLYTISYIGVERGVASFQRTLWWFIGNGILATIIIRSGKQIALNNY